MLFAKERGRVSPSHRKSATRSAEVNYDQQVGEGDLETRAPVVSDDEIGRLTGGFNDDASGLEKTGVHAGDVG